MTVLLQVVAENSVAGDGKQHHTRTQVSVSDCVTLVDELESVRRTSVTASTMRADAWKRHAVYVPSIPSPERPEAAKFKKWTRRWARFAIRDIACTCLCHVRPGHDLHDP